MKWINVKNELPDKTIGFDSINCFVFTKDKNMWAGYYDYEQREWYLDRSTEIIHNVTHWINIDDVPQPE